MEPIASSSDADIKKEVSDILGHQLQAFGLFWLKKNVIKCWKNSFPTFIYNESIFSVFQSAGNQISPQFGFQPEKGFPPSFIGLDMCARTRDRCDVSNRILRPWLISWVKRTFKLADAALVDSSESNPDYSKVFWMR